MIYDETKQNYINQDAKLQREREHCSNATDGQYETNLKDELTVITIGANGFEFSGCSRGIEGYITL